MSYLKWESPDKSQIFAFDCLIWASPRRELLDTDLMDNGHSPIKIVLNFFSRPKKKKVLNVFFITFKFKTVIEKQ